MIENIGENIVQENEKVIQTAILNPNNCFCSW